jgi:hypothetical protein
MNKPKWIAALLVAATLASSLPPIGFACGPFLEDVVLTFGSNPDLPLKRFVSGELGIISPEFAKSYLVVAYRYLSHKPLNKHEQEGVYSLWRHRIGYNYFSNSDGNGVSQEDPTKTWLNARVKIVGDKNPPQIDVDRRIASGDASDFDTFVNCTAGSFINASAVLAEKIAKHGALSPFVKDWVKAQDLVFCHCGTPGGSFPDSKAAKPTEPPFPEPAKDVNDHESIHDREYQHAAALFYAKQYDSAADEFKKAAGEANSPYAKISRFMVARCLTRKATLGKMPEDARRALLGEAAKSLREMLDDKSMSELHSSCRDLLGFVEFRRAPEERLKELSAELLANTTDVVPAAYYRSLDDYTQLLVNVEGGPDDPYATNKKKKPPLPLFVKNDDLSDWITTWERNDPAQYDYAVDKWKKTKNEVWLLAALHLAPSVKSRTDEVIKGAQEVEHGDPGYLSINYEAAHVRKLRGEVDEGIKEIGVLWEVAAKRQMWSSLNALMNLRGTMRINLQQFVDNSIRKPAAFAVFDEYLSDEFNPPSSGDKKNSPPKYVFGSDNARFMNERMPLSKLVAVCLSQKLPKSLQADADQAAWTRSVILNDAVSRSKISPGLQRDFPALVPLIKAADQGTEADRMFAAALLILKNPGMRPYVRSEAPRVEALGKLDTYSDNWWDAGLPDQEVIYQEKGEIVRSKLHDDIFPDLLSRDEVQAAATEKKRLLAVGAAPTYLCQVVSAYGVLHMTDPRLPEALHLAVRASHYGHSEKRTTPFSKKCFQLLHNNFPKNEFTAQTPYYY